MLPHQELFASLLERAAGNYLLERRPRASFDEALLRSLHELAHALMAEPYEHFAVHAHTNDEVHVFRRRSSGELAGFQFWRCIDGSEPGQRIVLGGKLRMQPADRRRGLHLLSNLSVLIEQQQAFPRAQIVRLSVASLFGFCSIARRLAHYDFIDAQSPRSGLIGAVDLVTSASRYRFDPETGLVDVGIFMTDEQLSGYPPEYFETPQARQYAQRNPRFRDNGCYLAWAFDADEENLRSLSRGWANSARCSSWTT